MPADMSEKALSPAWEEALSLFPGGVNSPVRAFKGVGGEPFFARAGRGPYLDTEDGRTLIDLVLSWGPLILGHAHPAVVAAVQEAVALGASFGVPTLAESRLARLVIERFPSLGRIRFVNSGTEATMSAIRLARACTGRDLCVKMEGSYHGHADGLLVAAGSGAATLGVPDSPGVPAAIASCTAVVPYNDLAALERLFAARGGEIACVILEPVAGNMGLVPPDPGYLEGVRALTRDHGALLIFDEVMTGFRVSPGGAQARYGVTPDLTALGKVIGGGLPVGAYGGREDLMARVAPGGPVYQAGTLSGNPLAMAAGIATLTELGRPGVFEALEARAAALADGLADRARAAGAPATVHRAGAMTGLFFHPGPVRNYTDAAKSDTRRYARFFHAMLGRGVYLPPSQFEAFFLSTAHDDAIITRILDAADASLRELT
jgi:glutamate-1-semialdehyde 2,1-aminomutase